MQPAKTPHPVKARRQHVLQEAAQELEGLQIDMPPLAGGAVTVRPAQLPIGQPCERPIAGGGLEDVAAQVTQRVGAGAHRRAVRDPTLFPDARRDVLQRRGVMAREALAEQGASVVAQGLDRHQELFAGGHPGALVPTQPAAGHQEVDVRMMDQGAAPGVQHAQHAQRGAEALGVLRQVLQRARAGGEERVVARGRMAAQPGPQGLGHGEGHQEVGPRQEQRFVGRQPRVGVGGAAARAMPVIAGMVAVVPAPAVPTAKHFAAARRGAAGEDRVQDLTVARRQRRREARTIGRSPLDQHLMHGEAFAAAARNGGRGHERGGLRGRP